MRSRAPSYRRRRARRRRRAAASRADRTGQRARCRDRRARRTATAGCRRRRAPGRDRRTPGGIERAVVGQDLSLDLLQLRAGFEAELVGQSIADSLVRGQGVGLAAIAVERGDQQHPQALLERVGGDRRFQLADHVTGLAQLGTGREPRLDQLQLSLFESCPVRGDPITIAGTHEEVAAEHRQRRSAQFSGRTKVARIEKADGDDCVLRSTASASTSAGSTTSVYPPSPLTSREGSARARRSLATFDWSVFRLVLTASTAHRSSTSRSVRTRTPASSARRTSNSDVFPAGIGTSSPARLTSTGPSTEIESTRRVYGPVRSGLRDARRRSRRRRSS